MNEGKVKWFDSKKVTVSYPIHQTIKTTLYIFPRYKQKALRL